MTQCPYCGKNDLDWTEFKDEVIWNDDESGAIRTYGVRCRDKECRGKDGFIISVGFICDDDDTEYTDCDGNEIEEE